jgi:CBS domain-containing protein
VEEAAREIARAAEETAEHVRQLTVAPAVPGRSLKELSYAVGEFADDLVRTNAEITGDLIRLANPAPIMRLQRRFARGYFQAMAKGQAAILRATQYAAAEMLRPLEERLEQRGHRRQRYTRVADVMSRNLRIASPEETVQQAARLMDEQETGVLPVGESDRLVGMVTDRDVAIRLVAQGKDAARTKVREVMTPEVKAVFDDDTLEHAANYMAEQRVRRLPVVNHHQRPVGILSLSDLVRDARADQRTTTSAMSGISREGGPHTQRASSGMR